MKMMFRRKIRGGAAKVLPTAIVDAATVPLPSQNTALLKAIGPVLGILFPLLLAGVPLIGKKIVSSLAKKKEPKLTDEEQVIINKEINKLTEEILTPQKEKKKGGAKRKPVAMSQLASISPLDLFSAPREKKAPNKKKNYTRGISLAQLEGRLGMGVMEY